MDLAKNWGPGLAGSPVNLAAAAAAAAAAALLAGRVATSGSTTSTTTTIDGWTDLRTVLFFKDESCTDIRPIGIGEAIRREARTDALEP